jgi:hypothetical protein
VTANSNDSDGEMEQEEEKEQDEAKSSDIIRIAIDLRFAKNFEGIWNQQPERHGDEDEDPLG